MYQVAKCLQYKNVVKRVKFTRKWKVNATQIQTIVHQHHVIVKRLETKLQWCNKRKAVIRIQESVKCGCEDIEERYQAELTNYNEWKSSFEERVRLWKLKATATNVQHDLVVVNRQYAVCAKKIAHLAEQEQYKI